MSSVYKPKVAIVTGDSLSSGQTVNLQHTWTTLLNAHPLISPRITIGVSAVGGDVIQQMQARYTSNVKDSGADILIFCGGVNNFNLNNETGDFAWGLAEDLIDEALADGMIVLAVALNGWEDYVSWTNYKQTQYEAFHAYMAAKVAPGYHFLNLYAAYPNGFNDPNNPTKIDPALDFGDHLHHNDFAQGWLAGKIAEKLNAMFPAVVPETPVVSDKLCDADDIRAMAPEFSALTDAQIQYYIDLADLEINEEAWGSRAKHALMLLTCHKMISMGVLSGASSSSVGPISSTSVGDVSVSYAATATLAVQQGLDASLSGNKYGIEYNRLVKLAAYGGAVLDGS